MTYVEFDRKLNTGDSKDWPIDLNNTMPLVWAGGAALCKILCK